jgi:hypothetical protein
MGYGFHAGLFRSGQRGLVFKRPTRRENRSAQALMPPLPLMNWSSGSESGLYFTYRMSRDHLPLVRLSAFAGSAVQVMMAANGSSRSNTSNRCEHRARSVGPQAVLHPGCRAVVAQATFPSNIRYPTAHRCRWSPPVESRPECRRIFRCLR